MSDQLPVRRISSSQFRAFTLLELTVVVLVISILAATVLPRWSDSLQRCRVTNAAKRLATDLERAQSAAFRSSSSKTVTVDPAMQRYDIPSFTSMERSSATFSVALNDPPYHSTIVSAFGLSTAQTITFDGYDMPTVGGTIVLASGSVQRSVVIDKFTGAITVP